MVSKAQLKQRLEKLEQRTPEFQELTKEQMFDTLYNPMHEDYHDERPVPADEAARQQRMARQQTG